MRLRQPRVGVRTKASSFTDLATAELAVSTVFRTHRARAEAWSRDDGHTRLALETWFHQPLGTVVTADDRVRNGHVACVVATHEGTGVLVRTAFLNIGEPDAGGALPSAHHDALFQLFSAVLNEEFVDSYTSVEAGVADFAACYPAPYLQAALDDLRVLRTRYGDGPALMDQLLALGNGIPAGGPHPLSVTDYVDVLDRSLAWHAAAT